MRASALHASVGAPAPKELLLAFQVRQWGALPEAGGLLDQPAGLLHRMTQAYNAYETVRSKLATTNDDAWFEASKSRGDFYMYLRKLMRDGNN